MKRIAYDADAKVYTFRDREGNLWRGPPEHDYGELKPVPKSDPVTRPGAFANPGK
jgi:hypothetical protein